MRLCKRFASKSVVFGDSDQSIISLGCMNSPRLERNDPGVPENLENLDTSG